MRKQFTNEEIKEILFLYELGKTQQEIGALFNSYNTSIRRVLKRNNIPIRSNSTIQCFVEGNPFNVQDSKSNYFIGLLVTDGCITNGALSISLKDSDIYILEELAKFLGPKVKLNKYFHNTHGKYFYYVKTRSKEVINYLHTTANFINKSYDLALYIPLNFHLLRVVFDGDGGVTFLNHGNSLKWFVCSASKVFIYQIKSFLESQGFNPTLTKSKNLYYVNLYRISEISKLFTLLYQDADIFLIRKYEKMATFLEKSKMENSLNSGKG